eukprot:3539928-Pleurochrysis_carterae.AAC.1
MTSSKRVLATVYDRCDGNCGARSTGSVMVILRAILYSLSGKTSRKRRGTVRTVYAVGHNSLDSSMGINHGIRRSQR